MATTITLKIKDEQGNITKQQHEIEAITLFQFQKMMEILKDILNELKEDNSLKEFLSEIIDEKSIEEADPEELLKEADMQFILKAINSFETIAVKMPHHAFKLLSVLSGIELSILQKQKFIDVLDIYDAVIEENDIERLIARIKKSLGATAAKMKFLNLVKKATNQTQP